MVNRELGTEPVVGNESVGVATETTGFGAQAVRIITVIKTEKSWK
jgi:hypothetical protein